MHIGLCDQIRLARPNDSIESEGALVDSGLNEVLVNVVDVLAGDDGFVVFVPLRGGYGVPAPLYQADSQAFYDAGENALGHFGVVVHNRRVSDAPIDSAKGD
jgi:hypothetical protein